MDASGTPLLRRNGKRPSCEPCRKAKYSCDHVMPVCLRCRRRNLSQQCVYHPSPLRGRTPRKSGKDGRRLTAEVLADALSDADEIEWGGKTERNHAEEFGYLGSTSCAAALTENGGEPGVDTIIRDPKTTGKTTGGKDADHNTAHVRPRRMEKACSILKLLDSFAQLEQVVKRWHEFERYTSMIEPFVGACTESVKSDLVFNGALGPGDPLQRTIQMIFQNTCRNAPISDTFTLAQFTACYTGFSLRWETLAVFFTACGLCCCCLPPTEPIFELNCLSVIGKQKFIRRLLEASITCVSFCEDTRPLSDLGIWVHYESVILSSHVLGEYHNLVWDRFGDTATHIVARGLHVDSERPEQPLWLIEMRRRGVACAYAMDKLFCTFCGRPPRLSQRYCSIHVPLDLPTSSLSLQNSQFQAALANINNDGWNTNGLQEKSFLRCFVLCSQVREKILELCLGPSGDNLLQEAKGLITCNQHLLHSLPESVRYEPDPSAMRPPSQVFMAAQEYLGLLYNEFMVRRTLCRCLREGPDELLQLSQRILSIVVEVSNMRSSLTSTRRYVPWVTIFYGLPPAGCLALELLRHKRQQVTLASGFPRSQVIQDLSVFVSSLKWVYFPGDGMYSLADQARKFLQQILDLILTDSTTSDPPCVIPTSASESTGVEFVDDIPWFGSPSLDADFWLNLPADLPLP